ncbi:Tyrosine-protein kinase, partial [Trichostrongylus colubriformis]
MQATVAVPSEQGTADKIRLDGKDDKNVESGNKVTIQEGRERASWATTEAGKAVNDKNMKDEDGYTIQSSQDDSLQLAIPAAKSNPNSQVDRLLEKALADLEKEEWYHGYLPLEDIIELLTRPGDFLLRGLELEEHKTTACVTVKWGGQVHNYPVQYMERNGAKVFTLDGINNSNDVMILVRFHLSTETPIKDEVCLRRPISRCHWELASDKVKMIQKIGNGTFGEAWWGTMREGPGRPPINIAVKLTKLSAENQKFVNEMFEKARLLRQYKHRNIVKFYGVARKSADVVMIVLEFVPGCSLDKFLKQKSDVDIRTKVGYAIDVAAALDYLHSKNCLHRNIACRHCLINVAENLVKLSDFSLSKQTEKYNIPEDEKLPLAWYAPEAILTRVYTAKCDVYSYGIFVWEIFNNADTPFKDVDQKMLKDKISNPSFRPRIDPELPEVAHKVMKACWQADPVKRPAMSQVILFLIQAPPEMLEPPKKAKPRRDHNQTDAETRTPAVVAGSSRSLSKRKKSRAL